MIKKLPRRTQAGYSVIELVAVISIMLVLFFLTVGGLRGSQEHEDLIAAQRILVGDLRGMQTKAITGVDAAGYGVSSNGGSEYQTVAYRYNLPEDSCSGEFVAGWDRDCPGETTTCSVCKLILRAVSLNQVALPRINIGFPDPTSFEIYFYRAPSNGRGEIIDAAQSLIIGLEHAKSGEKVGVSVDASGSLAQVEAIELPD